MLLVTILCRKFRTIWTQRFWDVTFSRIQWKSGSNTQLRAEPHLFETAQRLPEANHICTCPNVSKPIRAISWKWKILKTLSWAFAFFKELMIYFNKITLWCKYLLSFPAVRLMAFILFFSHFPPGWDVGLVIYSSYQKFSVRIVTATIN